MDLFIVDADVKTRVRARWRWRTSRDCGPNCVPNVIATQFGTRSYPNSGLGICAPSQLGPEIAQNYTIKLTSCSLCHRRHTPVGFASTILPVLRFRRRCHRRARRRGRCLHQTLYALLTLPFLLATKNVRNIIIVAYVESHTTVTPLKQDKTYDVAAPKNKRR